MRPKSVVNFERMMLATIAGDLIRFLWEMFPLRGLEGLYELPALLVIDGAIIALTLLIARKASKIAMWILLILAGTGVPFYGWMIISGVLYGWLLLWQLALALVQISALAMLFTPSAKAWFNRETRSRASAVAQATDPSTS